MMIIEASLRELRAAQSPARTSSGVACEGAQ
jgi:hypothetical protein